MKEETQSFFDALRVPTIFLLILWVVHISKVIFSLPLGRYGIYPRDIAGLKGVLLAPLIHGDFHHLISNSVPVFALTFIIFLFYKRVALASFVMIYLVAGFTVWLFARPVFHIGASGLVYGLVAFVFWNGIFRRNVKSIILALIVTVLYSGYFLGVLPNQEGISWESHLIGGIVGIIVSFIFKGTLEEDEIENDPWAHEANEEKRYFLAKDTFAMTKVERREMLLRRARGEEE